MVYEKRFDSSATNAVFGIKHLKLFGFHDYEDNYLLDLIPNIVIDRTT